ncbi:MAG: hypothetical protein D6701_07410 [Gemmatimonadetes bacterium]|nr:MAG: hypothetical protein D6701_07410 [Gemmatimonadota bacterium]
MVQHLRGRRGGLPSALAGHAPPAPGGRGTARAAAGFTLVDDARRRARGAADGGGRGRPIPGSGSIDAADEDGSLT